MADGGDDIPLTCISNDQLQLQINALLVYPFTFNFFFKLFGKQTHTDIFGPIVKIPIMLGYRVFGNFQNLDLQSTPGDFLFRCWSEFRILHYICVGPFAKEVVIFYINI